MAHLNHGPAAVVPRAPAAEQAHVQAFFRPLDEAATIASKATLSSCSRAGALPFASVPLHDSPAGRASSSPFTFTPSPSHARPPPFPFIAPNGTSSAPPAPLPHPSTFEGAKGLMLMRQSAEPLSALPTRDQRAPVTSTVTATPTAIAPSPAPSLAVDKIASPALTAFEPSQSHALASVSVQKNESESHAPSIAGPLLHPVISASPEDNSGRHSDIFSTGENSDTITDPDIDTVVSSIQTLSQPPNCMPFQSQARRLGAPLVAHPNINQPGANDLSAQQTLLPAPAQLDKAGSSPALNGSVVEDENQALSQATAPTARKLYDPSAPILPVHGIQCYCRAVPDVFLNILDEKSSPDANLLAKLYGACKDDLCPLHLNAYAKLITGAVEAVLSIGPMAMPAQQRAEKEQQADKVHSLPVPTFTGAATQWKPVSIRRRKTSTPGIYEYEYESPHKRRRVVEEDSRRPYMNGTSQLHQDPNQQSAGWPRPPAQQPRSCRPSPSAREDDAFRRKVLAELAQNFTDKKEDDWSRGETTNRYIHAILSKCQHPNTDLRNGPVEAGFLSGREAAHVIESGTERIPIFTEGQQQFLWSNRDRPIDQLFHRMEDLTREVSVQIPSHDFDVPSYETKSLTEVRDRFTSGRSSQDPWNILDLRSPLPPSILPSFLTGENCQLLPRIRDSLLEGQSAERTKASREEWNEWTDLLEWVLMSEGGHNTAPHMDSHGWSTWITIQEGQFGFGWLSRPTDQEQNAWMKDPLEYTGGNWRFVILKPGQTVFFPSGTVHFVFRLHAEQTLALGGHLLQWTSLERWVQVILYQLRNPNITNEDLGQAPLKYIRSARKLVDNRMATCRVGSMGSMDNVTRFMALATVSNTQRLSCSPQGEPEARS